VSAIAPYPRTAYGYRTPGVYFEWLDPQSGIRELRSDVAGFVGIAEKGPLHQPVRVTSWTQFTSTFGAHIAQGYLAYAVEGYFANGGDVCWAVRVADPATAREASIDLVDDEGSPTLRLTATSPGTWGARVTVSVARLSQGRFSLVVRLDDGTTEIWRNLTMAPGDPRAVERVLNDPGGGSRLVVALDLGSSSPFPASLPNPRGAGLRRSTGRLSGGADGLATLAPSHMSGEGAPARGWGIATLEDVDEVSVVAAPDVMDKPVVPVPPSRPEPLRCEVLDAEPPLPPVQETASEFPPPFADLEVAELQQALVRHCARLKNRMAVIDVRRTDTTPELALFLRGAFDSSYAALYYPWLRVPDPLRLQGILRPVPPSGHVAGVYARVEHRAGVHKPPANEPLEGVHGLTAETDEIAHGDLNEAGVNVIRVFKGRGPRIAGARTLSSATELRYVNVRRLLLMIEKAIDVGSQWTVFESNGPELWREVDRIVRDFLQSLWRRGMLDGARVSEAYLVRCDETTNPVEERDAGRLHTVIGVQPPWPAEFVIVRIGKTESATEVSEGAGSA